MPSQLRAGSRRRGSSVSRRSGATWFDRSRRVSSAPGGTRRRGRSSRPSSKRRSRWRARFDARGGL